MKILIVEDDVSKRDRITSVLRQTLADTTNSLTLHTASSLVDARCALAAQAFDLMILDIRLPIRVGEVADDTAGMLLLEQLFVDDEYHRPRYVVGISGVEDLYAKASKLLHRHGWVLLKYSPTDQAWADSLSYFIKHVRFMSAEFTEQLAADVVILTALEDPEFTSILKVFPELRGPRSLDGKTLYWEGEVLVEGRSLRIVAGYSWQMGLTAAAILADKFISAFHPRLIAMTGICAGFENDISLGDVIVATQSWEWQGGKIKDSAEGPHLLAAPEPYRGSRTLITDLHALTLNADFSKDVTRQYYPQDTDSVWKVHFGPIVSGLSVVASATVMQEVKAQHRKMLGLEMEAYAIYAAAEFNSHECQRIVMKGVCDFGSAAKGDGVQRAAAMRSALLLRALLGTNQEKYAKN